MSDIPGRAELYQRFILTPFPPYLFDFHFRGGAIPVSGVRKPGPEVRLSSAETVQCV